MPVSHQNQLLRFFVFLCLLGFALTAEAQIRKRGGTDAENAVGNFTSDPPQNPDIEKLFRNAKKLVAEGHYTDGVEWLQRYINGEKVSNDDRGESREDLMYRDEQKRWRSLRMTAVEIIASLPADARQMYEDKYGPAAKRLLDDAVAHGDLNGLESVTRQYLHTPAGREASLMVAQAYLDLDQPLQAALSLHRVAGKEQMAKHEPMLSLTLAHCWLQGGQAEHAVQTLAALKSKLGKAAVPINGKQVPWFEDAKQTDDTRATEKKVAEWLAMALGNDRPSLQTELTQWHMFRGSASRNAISVGGKPMLGDLNFSVDLLESSSDVIKQIEEMQSKQVTDGSIVQLPSFHACAVHDAAKQVDWLIVRGEKRFLAIDMRNGKRVWEYPPQNDSPTPSPTAELANQNVQMFGGGRMIIRGNVVFNGGGYGVQGQARPSWDNATYGTCSSDGKYLYVIETSMSPIAMQALNMVGRQRQVILPNGSSPDTASQISNKLVALEISTQGKTVWSVGGEKGECDPQLAGAYFLGPPLPLMGQLYCLVERKGTIQLCVLDPKKKSGQLLWSQTLAVLSENNGNFWDDRRRFAGLSPSFADGILVCPTGADQVVAVDLASRAILWNHQYNGVNLNQDNPYANQVEAQSGQSQWADTSATIAEGHVLLTSIEAKDLMCLSLVDGKLKWKRDRKSASQDDFYLACVHKGNAIIVGRKEIHAIKLSDGSPGWKNPESIAWPDHAVPVGRGVYATNRYYIPLSSGLIVNVNLDDVKITDEVRGMREPAVFGNLMTFNGNLISHNLSKVSTYRLVEPSRAWVNEVLAKNPDHTQALKVRGMIRLSDQDTANAMADLRHAVQLEKKEGDVSKEAHQVLFDVLLTQLEKNYTANFGTLSEIATLISSPHDKARLLRVVAPEEAKAGRVLEGIKAYLELADLDSTRTDLERIEMEREVRRDRWIQGKLSGLMQIAKPEDHLAIQEVFLTRLAKLPPKVDEVQALRSFLGFFGSISAAEEARDRLSTKVSGVGSNSEKELLLQSLLSSKDESRRRSAVARLALLLRDSTRPVDATIYYEQLRTEFAKEVCLNGKTGQQLYEDLPADSPIRAKSNSSKPWPRGMVKADPPELIPNNRGNGRIYSGIEFRGERGPFFEGVAIAYDQQTQSIIAREGSGHTRWSVNLFSQAGLSGEALGKVQLFQQFFQQNSYMQANSFAQANGHLLYVSYGMYMICIDSLGSESQGGAKVRWYAPLFDDPTGRALQNGVQQESVPQPAWGGPVRNIVLDAGTKQILGNVGNISSHGICVQRGRDIVCFDRLTGEVAWVRHGAPSICQIVSDEEYTLILTKDGKDSLILRTADGEKLFKRDLPPQSERWTTIGRKILTWKAEQGKIRLSMIDPCGEQGKTTLELWKKEFAAPAKGAIISGDEFAVLGSDGEFRIAELVSGKPILSATVEKLPSLSAIFVLRSAEQYHLIASQQNPTSDNISDGKRTVTQVMSAYNNQPLTALVTGSMWAFDRKTGTSQWNIPVEIQKHGLLLNQPLEAPVITFIRHFTDGTSSRPKSSILCIDKRTGRAVYENNDILNYVFNIFDVSGDPESRVVKLNYQNQVIKLTFTEDVRPPEPPYQASVDGPPGKPAEEAAKRIGSGIGRILGGRRPATDDPFEEAQEAAPKPR